MKDSEVLFGTVVWFNGPMGYGFIAQQNSKTDIFVHFSDIEKEGYKVLKKNQKVSYAIGTNNRGEPKAVNVKVLE
jgi:CspA family cold shock protein